MCIRDSSKTDQYLLEHRCVTKRGKQFTRFAIRGILTNPVYMIADETAHKYLKENNVDLFAERAEFDGEHGIMAYNRTLQRPGKANQIRPMEEWIVAVGKHPGIIAGSDWVDVYKRQIQHSLRCYQYEGHFRHLRDLYEKGELTSAINRVVEDINHRFTLEVLSQDWKSHDLGISASNLRRDRKNPTDILDRIDLALVTDSLRKLLEIRNRAEQTVALDDVHAAEIKEYLDLLDLTREINVLHLPDVSTKSSRTVIAQPGLRYAQADALIRSLLLDETFSALSLAERTAVQQRILTEIKGRMLEDIVLLETKLANPKKQVFVLQFPVGEFDMVVFDPEAGSCRIFEIKHSEEAVPQQYRHLIDEQKCAQAEHRYGPITGKIVLYRGESQVIDGIRYQNVEEYLRSLA